ncbi:hypothetical protein Acsp04_18370 [Actinomadura sp. NBRC 104425]|nr:hypothetical protein Acsp04_18370 [Actinomadura sp. NBRC 104425]
MGPQQCGDQGDPDRVAPSAGRPPHRTARHDGGEAADWGAADDPAPTRTQEPDAEIHRTWPRAMNAGAPSAGRGPDVPFGVYGKVGGSFR